LRNVLFLCTGNSARSIMAEVMLNHLGRDGFKAYSAGSHPTGSVNRLAIETLGELGWQADDLRSKAWDEFAAPGAPRVDFVITVCDSAAGETCPIWPGRPVNAHWGIADPAAVRGSEEARREAFRSAAATLRRRIEFLVKLPLDDMDPDSVQRKLREAGAL
jgi:arsenate reductase (thioredoxin)